MIGSDAVAYQTVRYGQTFDHGHVNAGTLQERIGGIHCSRPRTDDGHVHLPGVIAQRPLQSCLWRILARRRVKSGVDVQERLVLGAKASVTLTGDEQTRPNTEFANPER